MLFIKSKHHYLSFPLKTHLDTTCMKYKVIVKFDKIMSQLCFICNKLLTVGKIVTVSREMKTLIDASSERGDEFVDYLKSSKEN